MCAKKLFKSVGKAVGGVFGLLPEGPKAPEAPPAPGAAPTAVDPGVSAAREDERRRRAAAAGQKSTILTGAQGLTSAASTGQKTLLGA